MSSDLRSLMRDGLSPTPSYVCHYCEVKLSEEEKTLDHIVPRALSGLDVRWNTVVACRKCNSRKADTWPTCRCSKCSKTIRKHWEILHIRADKPKRVNRRR